MIREGEPLAPYTTLGVGGRAKYFVVARTPNEVHEAWEYARRRKLQIAILGGGSNLLVPDEGINAFVIQIAIEGIKSSGATLKAGAGVSWDALVEYAVVRNLWGIENLAGIPGTVGGAVVQNIGAYGAELKNVFHEAEVFDLETGTTSVIGASEADFSYRSSMFKKRGRFVVLGATFKLEEKGSPQLSYPDLARIKAEGIPLATPTEVGQAVREIRSKKFPDLRREGTAGSFFKNPQVSSDTLARLRARYPELPSYAGESGQAKIPLAWLLDRALSLRGYAKNNVRLFEKQPLVIVAERGASARAVDALACEIAAQVKEKIGIEIEREVETLAPRS